LSAKPVLPVSRALACPRWQAVSEAVTQHIADGGLTSSVQDSGRAEVAKTRNARVQASAAAAEGLRALPTAAGRPQGCATRRCFPGPMPAHSPWRGQAVA